MTDSIYTRLNRNWERRFRLSLQRLINGCMLHQVLSMNQLASNDDHLSNNNQDTRLNNNNNTNNNIISNNKNKRNPLNNHTHSPPNKALEHPSTSTVNNLNVLHNNTAAHPKLLANNHNNPPAVASTPIEAEEVSTAPLEEPLKTDTLVPL